MTESDEVSLKKRDIKQHYQREEVQQIIRKSADYKGFHKAGKCDDKGLYRYKKKTGDCLISVRAEIINTSPEKLIV